MAPRTTTGKSTESGFTLAGVLVIMTIMMIIVAYTVPRAWSTIVQRDRERRTIQLMQEYAKAIDAFEAKNHALPVSVDQLIKARQPRFLRGKGEMIDPLSGQSDWFIVTSATGVPVATPGVNPVTSSSTPTIPPGIPMKEYAGGPFVGIRPGKNGSSLIELNGSSKYEEWRYNVQDYRNDRTARLQSAAKKWQ